MAVHLPESELEAQTSRFHLMAYGPGDNQFMEVSPSSMEEAREHFGRFPVTWLNINTNSMPTVIASLEASFGLHPLALEDVRNPRQRPKTEDYGDYLFVVTRMPFRREDRIQSEQLCMFIARGWLITIQETPGDVLTPVRDRIRVGRSRMRNSGADYLAYAILDAVVDSYFPLMEAIGNRLEELEDAALEPGEANVTQQVVEVKRDLLLLRRIAWPQREAVAFLEHGDHTALSRESRPFFRDVYDHTVRIIDVIEVYRELASDIQGLHLATVNTRMNEVMKVLTIMTSLFVPLTFIASIYGMNFHTDVSPWNMPELDWAFGYPAVLAVMGAVAFVLIVFFRRKGWM
ncbi:MAG TPA: magnesium/cobalt transporter CorA [Candidatus Thermoplasmatota archaeon]|nr:magnesium/cobalt transporter CorA [Candidatus Thermoplasmatota archaeon]